MPKTPARLTGKGATSSARIASPARRRPGQRRNARAPVRGAASLATPFAYPLTHVPAVDAVGVEERATELSRRSIKRESKLWALETAISMVDLTTLEGADTPGKALAVCRKAVRPDPLDPSVPSVAAVCVYPTLVPTVAAALAGTGVRTAAVATAFPSGQSPLRVRLAEVRQTVGLGAEEIDMVIQRGAFLAGRYARVFDEIGRVKEACGTAELKVILEVGELGTYDNVRRATMLAMAAGADFVKTSTGKIPRAATLPVVLVMLEAVRDFHEETGLKIGVKAAGGIGTAKLAIQYLVLVHETLGPDWLTPALFRIGASSLVNDLLMQIRKQRTGAYQSPDDFTLD